MALPSFRRKAERGNVAAQEADQADKADHDPDSVRSAAASLLMADIVMRIGSSTLRHFVERRFLKGKFGPDTARKLLRERSAAKSLTSMAIARLATRSVPGAALVGTSLLAKTLYERGKARRNDAAGRQTGEIEPPAADRSED